MYIKYGSTSMVIFSSISSLAVAAPPSPLPAPSASDPPVLPSSIFRPPCDSALCETSALFAP